jgi:hypothetical protein
MAINVIQFAAYRRIGKMATPNQPTVPQQAQDQGQVLPPAVPQAPVQASISQFTAISAYVPPQVWTEEALLDFHAKQKDVILDNNRIFQHTQDQQNLQSWAGIVIVAGIICFACYLTILSNPLGEKILGVTVAFLAGFMAGRGKANLK